MRRRGLASPDDGDALALTFAYPVARRDWAEERRFDEGPHEAEAMGGVSPLSLFPHAPLFSYSSPPWGRGWVRG